MQYLIIFLLVIFAHNPLQAQTLRFKFVDNFRGVARQETVVLVNQESFLYESKQTDGHKWVEEVKLYTSFEDYRWYFDVKTGRVITHRILKDGTELISSYKPTPLNWILSEEEKTILGYRCFKAVLPAHEAKSKGFSQVDNSGDIIVWYSPDIPVGAGIRGMHGLPGMVLLQESTEEMSFTTVAISVEKTETTIQKPTEGIEVPRELIEKSSPSKKELKKYMEVKDK